MKLATTVLLLKSSSISKKTVNYTEKLLVRKKGLSETFPLTIDILRTESQKAMDGIKIKGLIYLCFGAVFGKNVV